jgi:hypothetical protein
MDDRRSRFIRALSAPYGREDRDRPSRYCQPPLNGPHALRQHGIGDLDQAGDVTTVLWAMDGQSG